jgi:putative endonuclease
MIFPNFYVYILACKDGTFYTGQTRSIRMRLNQHNGLGYWPGSRYTKTRRPVFLQHLEKFPTRKDALKREREIKNMTKEERSALIQRTTKGDILSAI